MFYRVLWGWNKTKDVKRLVNHSVSLKDSSSYQTVPPKAILTDAPLQRHCEGKGLQLWDPQNLLVIKSSEQGCPGQQAALTLVSLNEARLGFKGLVTDVLKRIIWTGSSQEPVLLGSIHSYMPHVLNILIKTLPLGTKYLGKFLRKFVAIWVLISSLVYPSVLKNKEKETINNLGSRWYGHQRAGK